MMYKHYDDPCSTGNAQPPSLFRVISYNVGGLPFRQESERVCQLCEFCSSLGTDLRALQETHRNWQQVHSVRSYKRWVDVALPPTIGRCFRQRECHIVTNTNAAAPLSRS
jgi:hypothetical protein